jgi:Fe-S-cluster containining protein
MHEFPVHQLAEDIARCWLPEEFDAAATCALSDFDRLSEPVVPRLACREGCSLCCESLRVDVFAHEVFLIAHYIRSHFSEEQLSDLLARLEEHAATVLPLTPFEHATRNVPCPLLIDHRCSVYAARPHSCRRHHSLDLAACQFTFDHPTDLEAPAAHDRELFRALSGMMQVNIEAYAEAGFDYTIYELGTALREALSDEGAFMRWRDQETAFHHASVTPMGGGGNDQ